MTDGLFWGLGGCIGICYLLIFRYMRRWARDAEMSNVLAANPPMMVTGGLQGSPNLTPGAITHVAAGMGGSSAANKTAHLQQQAIAQQVGVIGGAAAYAPSPLLQEPLYKLTVMLMETIMHTNYEPVAGAREVCQRVVGTMSLLGLQPSADDKRAVLRLAWRCRAILPPELATYAALGGGTDREVRTDGEGAESEAAAE